MEKSASHGPRPADVESKVRFEQLVRAFLETNPGIKQSPNQSMEFEIRFNASAPGLGSHKTLIKTDYDRAIAALLGAGFSADGAAQGIHMLRIQLSNEDAKSDGPPQSYVRAELLGLDLIQEYCRHNSLQKILDMPSSLQSSASKLKFTQKSRYVDPAGVRWDAVDVDDFGFRASFQIEEDSTPTSPMAREMISQWNDRKKTFRYMNRVRFSHPDFPVCADVSIVHENKTQRSTHNARRPKFIATHTLQESEVLRGPERYEVELELDNTRIGVGTDFDTPAKVLDALRKCIRIVLGGLQRTPYPIGFREMNQVKLDYMKLIHGPEFQERHIFPRDFVGPSSRTLQLENLVNAEDLQVTTVLQNYTVTDKADGERRLLFVSPNGRVYMIDMTMSVIFTGTHVSKKDQSTTATKGVDAKYPLENSLLDGEWIRSNRRGDPIQLYAAFDVYYVHGRNVREYGFIPPTESESGIVVEEPEPEEEEEMHRSQSKRVTPIELYRLPILTEYIQKLSVVSVVGGDEAPSVDKKKTKAEQAKERTKIASTNTASCTVPILRIQPKRFYSSNPTSSIFAACAQILSNARDGLYEYETDGIIFTPSHTGAGGDRVGTTGPNYKHTWDLSFKWKPPQYNTIDFLVTTQKDKKGRPTIHHHFQEGRNLQGIQDVAKYQVLILRVGFDPWKHAYANPWLSLIENDVPKPFGKDLDNVEGYRPVPFQPTQPSDSNACFAHVTLHDLGNGRFGMQTEEGEVFEEDTIVEFRYDFSREGAWKWVPIRVRHDKTSELRAGEKNYGNAYHVANNNWTSIHQPITEEMVTTGEGIPTEATVLQDEDVYYHRGADTVPAQGSMQGKAQRTITSTQAMRDFHNLYVKKKLILAVSNPGDILMDYAVGKGGDLPKWIQARLKFVFGLDISKDNIQNRLDGACVRYLKAARKGTGQSTGQGTGQGQRQGTTFPGALFVQGNSAVTLHRGAPTSKALATDKDREIMRAVFGQGPKDPILLGKGVHRYYGIASEGFHVSSIQFAIHYFFENARTLHAFMHNVADCTRIGGYCIGTCYDGERVFDELRKKPEGGGFVLMRDDRKMFELTRRFPQTGFPDDEHSLGYAIDVYQDSINKTFREYLVHPTFLQRIMEDYGFVPLTDAEAAQLGLPSSSDTFDRLFDAMNQDLKRNRNYSPNYGLAPDMSEDEKRISFLNRYFVFKKVRNVNLEHMTRRNERHHTNTASSSSATVSSTTATSSSAVAAESEIEPRSEEIVIQVKPSKKIPKQRIKIVSGPGTEAGTEAKAET